MDFLSVLKSIKIDLKLFIIPSTIIYIFWLCFNNDLLISRYIEHSHLFWIHLIGMLSIAYSTVLIAQKLIEYIKEELIASSRKNYLKNLSKEEKLLLKEFIYKERKTVNLPYQDGTVQNLSNQNIIYRSTTTSDYRLRFDYTIQVWAWNYLLKNKELLKADDTIVVFTGSNNFYDGAE